MANQELKSIIQQGVNVWNRWRSNNPDVRPNLTWIDLSGADLSEIDLSGADLSNSCLRNTTLKKSNLSYAVLNYADIRNAKMEKANFNQTVLKGVNFTGTNLSGANFNNTDLEESNFSRSNLSKTKFIDSNLINANFRASLLIKTNFRGSNLQGCRVFGISAWKLNLNEVDQSDLIITEYGEPVITVDNIEIAQFIYLLLRNKNIRNIIETIGKKAVLILGRFSSERKAVLDAIKMELRNQKYVPILFDFEKPTCRDTTETISILAHLSRFIIADITDARSIPQELQAIAPNLPSVPIQPIIHTNDYEYGMFDHFKRYPWVLPIYRYIGLDSLLSDICNRIIDPAIKLAGNT